MKSSIFSHGVKILPGTSFAEIRPKTLDVSETAESYAPGRGQCLLPFVEQHGRWLAETLQHTIRPEEVEHRAMLSRTVLYGYA
jgi:hypothetical protein